MNTQNTAPPSDAPKKKKRWPKILGGLIVVVVLLVVFAPALIASLGKGSVESAISDTIKGSVTIDSLSLSWLGGQSIEGLELRDPDGNRVVTIGSVDTNLTLLGALQGDLNLGKTVLGGVDGDIKLDADGVSNLQKAIALVEPAPETDEPAAVPPSLAIDAMITKAKIVVTPHDGEPATLSDLDISAGITSMTDPVTFNATGKTSQGGVTGNLAANGTLKNLFTVDGVVTAEKVDADVTVNITDMPSMLIDGLLPVHGLIAEAMGVTIEHAKLKANGTLESQNVNIDIKADRLIALLSGRVADGKFRLIESETIKLHATPKLVASLASLSKSDTPLRLTKPAWVTLELTGLVVPLKTTDLATTAVNAVLTSEPIELTGDERLGDVAINDLRVEFETDKLSELATFDINAATVTAGQPGSVKANGKVRGLVDISGNPQPDKMVANAFAEIKNVPAALLNRLVPIQLAEAHGDVPAKTLDFTWFGTALNAEATVATAEGGAKTIGLKVNTDKMTVDLPLAIDDTVRTTKPGSINWQAPKAAAVAFGLPESIVVTADTIPINISDFELVAPMPVEGAPAFQPDKTRVAGTMTIGNLVYKVDEENAVALSQLRAEFSGESLVNMTVDANTRLLVDASAKQLREQIGESATVTLGATIKTPDLTEFDPAKIDAVVNATLIAAGGQVLELFGSDAKIDITKKPTATDNFTLTVTSKRVNTTVPGTLTLGDNGSLAIKRSTLTATVRPELSPSLAEPTTAILTIAPTTIPLSGFDLTKLKTQVTGGFDPIVLAGGAAEGTVIKDLKITKPLVFDGPAAALSVAVTGRALAPGQTGEGSPIDVNANLANIFDSENTLAIAASKINARVNIKQLPTAVVDALAEQGGKLTPILGPTVDLDATVVTTGGDKSNGTAKLIARSANLIADADLVLTDGIVTLAPGKLAKIEWTMTPVAYASLTAPAPDAASQTPVASLAEPAKINITLKSLSAPIASEGGKTDMSKIAFDTTIDSDTIKLIDNKTNKSVAINGLHGSARSASLAKDVRIVANGKIVSAGIEKPGPVDIDAKFSDLFDADGVFNSLAYSAAVKAELVDITGALAEALFGSGTGKVAALIGESGTITADVNLKTGQGPAKITIDSQNTQADIDGRIENGVFRLNKDATASVAITEGLASKSVGGSVVDVLANMIFETPLLKTAVKSIEPVQLKIAAEGFEIPVDDFHIDKVKIAKGTLNPGKLIVENAGLIQILLTLPSNVRGLKIGPLLKDLASKDNIQAWFTDMPFSMNEGVARLGRMDMMLGENYQVAVWGTMNLSERATTEGEHAIGPKSGRMVLGLAERTMRRIYGINVFEDEPDYVDQFIMQGPLDTLGPDKGEMIARIALLTGVGATNSGSIIGIIKRVEGAAEGLGLKDKSDPAPPAPTTPWPTEEEEKAAEEAAKDAAKEPTDPDAPVTPKEPAPDPEPEPDNPKDKPDKPEKPKSDKEQLEDLGKDLLRDLLK